MKKSEFSETQFVLGFTRELFKNIKIHFNIFVPTTRDEKKWASDLIIKYFNRRGYYRYSEFYQFKRSKYFNTKIFNDLKGKILIDTSATPMFGFNIYNSKKTRQFNILQKLAAKPRNRVFYCAPLFYTIKDFNQYFSNSIIESHSKVFSFSQNLFQKTRIPLGSAHKVIFDEKNQYICSDPMEIEGYIASERNKYFSESESEAPNFESIIDETFLLIKENLSIMDINLNNTEVNFYEVRELLMRYFNIYWFPYFDNA